MGVIIEVSESKVDSLSENIEKALHYASKAMQCIDDLRGGGGYGERSHYGERYERNDDWGDGRMGERHFYDPRYGMGERRYRDSRGRYM